MNKPPENVIVAFRGEARRKGFAAVPIMVLIDKTLSCPAKVLYGVLVGYAIQSGGSIASQGDMAKDMDATDRSIRNWLKELEDRKLITIERQGQMKPNVYLIEDAYTLYQSEPPKKGNGRQPSSEPAFRSSEESSFLSKRNESSGHVGTSVPTLNKNSGKNKIKEDGVIASLSPEQKEPEQKDAPAEDWRLIIKAGASQFKKAILEAERNSAKRGRT